MFRIPFIATVFASMLAPSNALLGDCPDFELIEGHLLKLSCNINEHIWWDMERTESFLDLGDCYSNRQGELSLIYE